MDALRCPDGDAPIKNLSGGERRRVALCRLLLSEPDILLLDEPTNHLDAESVEWLELHLQQYKGTVIAVTHDRYFLDHAAGWILELDRGEGIPWKGNYSSWLDQKTKRMEMEEKTESKRRKTLERELEWVRMGAKARHAKSKARLSNYDKMMSEDTKQKEEKLELFIPNGPRLGNKVVEFQNVTKAFGDKVLFENLNFSLPPAGIVGIIGPNGAGKTTLFRLIMGLETPDSGQFDLGDGGRIGGALRLNLGHRLDDLCRAARITDPPAGHGIGLGDAIEDQGTGGQVRAHIEDVDEGLRVPADVLVHIVGSNQGTREVTQDGAQGLQLVRAIGHAGRIGRAVDHHQLGLVVQRGLELGRADLEVLIGPGMDQYRRTAGQQDDIRVGNPVGRRDHHLVTRIDDRQGQIEEALLAAAGHQDLVRGVVEPVLAFELGDHGRLEAGGAVHRGIFGETLVDRLDGRGLDVVRGIEVRLTGTQPDHVLSGRLEGLGAGIDGEGGRGLDGLNTGSELDGHRLSSRVSGIGWGDTANR